MKGGRRKRDERSKGTGGKERKVRGCRRKIEKGKKESKVKWHRRKRGRREGTG